MILSDKTIMKMLSEKTLGISPLENGTLIIEKGKPGTVFPKNGCLF